MNSDNTDISCLPLTWNVYSIQTIDEARRPGICDDSMVQRVKLETSGDGIKPGAIPVRI